MMNKEEVILFKLELERDHNKKLVLDSAELIKSVMNEIIESVNNDKIYQNDVIKYQIGRLLNSEIVNLNAVNERLNNLDSVNI